MCIASIYRQKGQETEKIMEEVVSMDIENNDIRLNTILGERKTITGSVKHVDFLKHTVTIQPTA